MADQDLTSKARKLKSDYEAEWMELEEVVAIGIGMVNDKPGIIISVKTTPNSIKQQVPSAIDGIPIRIEVSGEISAG